MRAAAVLQSGPQRSLKGWLPPPQATPGGVYTRKDVTWEVFSHEPEVVPGPNGEYIMYFTADLRSQVRLPCTGARTMNPTLESMHD